MEDAPNNPKTYGELAFDAYCKQRGGKNHDGTPTPSWRDIGEDVRQGWEAAAKAVREWTIE